MKARGFAKSPSGVLVPTENGRQAFVPHALPPAGLDLGPLSSRLAIAAGKLGELNGIGRTLDDPMLLVRPLQYQEALTSSGMEGTYTTIDDLLLVEADEQRTVHTDAREVRNYRRALTEAVASLHDIPLSLRTLKNAHARLLEGVTRHRDAAVMAGEFKTHQNYIGRSAEAARFIPPPPIPAAEAMAALEKYIHRNDDRHIPDLIDAALIHYQFEAIHPFADGNGRVGRMLIVLHLHARGVIDQPLLYLSPAFERKKDEYIDRMYEVSRSGAWTDWIAFFLEVVAESAEHAVKISDQLLVLKSRYRRMLQNSGRSARVLSVVDFLFTHPITTIPSVAQFLGVTYRAAQMTVDHLINAGILKEIPNLANPRIFVAHEIRNVIEKTQTNDA